MYFFKNFFLYSQEYTRQTERIVMMSTEGSIEIVNFMTPLGGVSFDRRGHTSHIVKMVTMLNFFTNLLYSEELNQAI